MRTAVVWLAVFACFVGTGSAHADETEDMAALAKKIGAEFKDFSPAKMSSLKLMTGKETDADLAAVLALKPKRLSDLNLQYGEKLTAAQLAKIADLPALSHLTLPQRSTDGALDRFAARLPSVRYLHLRHTKITAAGLKGLAGSELIFIDLTHAPVNDDCWKELAKLPALKDVLFAESPLKGTGVKQLAVLKQLEHLMFYNCKLTDAAVAELAEITSLRNLELDGTAVTDKGLVALGKMKGLSQLSLGNTKVTDAGLAALAGLDELGSLDLSNTAVTDAGLQKLAGLKKLGVLVVTGTKVTEAGAKRLKDACPNCTVLR
jgi:hypothetical protein